MSPYRKRFVQFNMLLIGIVLTIMVAAVAVYMVNDYYCPSRKMVIRSLKSKISDILWLM